MKICIPLIILIFVGCNELPLGEDELNARGDFSAHYIELTRFNSFTEMKNINLGASVNLIAGRNDEYESRILIKFNFPDSSYHGLDEIKMVLYVNNRFNNDTISCALYTLKQEFKEGEATWSKRCAAELWESPGGDYDGDSLCYFTIKGDSAVVYLNYIKLDRIKNSKGIIIIPQQSGFVHFYSREGNRGVQLRIIKNGAITTIAASADCHILTGPEPSYIDDWIGAGYAYRDYIKFNYSDSLNDKKAVYGELSFCAHKHFSMRDSFEIAVKELIQPYKNFDTPCGPIIALKKFSVDDTLFTFDIVKHIQRIIEHPDANFGLFIQTSPENYDISSFKIVRGSHRLVVGYVNPPAGRK